MFDTLASLTKTDGRFYVWVYKKQEEKKDKILLQLLDFTRFFISRLPSFLQKICVVLLTTFFYILSRIRKGENSSKPFEEIKTNTYDAFTPKYRSYHIEDEIKNWFIETNFASIHLTHSNNKYGFGMLGIRE